MNSIVIEKEKNIELLYKTFTLRFWRLRFSTYFKWGIWGAKYTYYNTGKMNGYKGFRIMCWPFEITYQVKT